MDDPPRWIRDLLPLPTRRHAPEELMALAIAIAQANAEAGHGPFGAVVADAAGAVVSVGWNAVVATVDSTAHAEILALRAAERALGTHDLRGRGLTLYASAAPCIQCYGAIWWCGIGEVRSAAGRAEAESIGFSEGPVDDALWARAQDERGIVHRPGFGAGEAARRPFATYRARGGVVY